MKNSKLFACLLIPAALLMASCHGKKKDNSSSSEAKDSTSISLLPEEETTLKEIERIMLSSKPTTISTRQVYSNPDVGIPLNYLMNVTIEYGSVIKVLYNYSYEKLASSSSESFTELVTGQYYAEGTSVAEVVGGEINWLSPVEKTLNLPAICINNTDYFSACSLDNNSADITIKNSHIGDVLGADYDIKDVNFRIIVNREAATLSELDINYKAASGASVRSVTTYGYEVKTIDINQ